MSISGHKTRSMLDRYNFTDVRDQREPFWRAEKYHEKQRDEGVIAIAKAARG